ncbi:Os03g0753750 [Oryza sativa Japonica Group]|jgi:hypothetical protein|uniref:Os03g0753750 protein n=1 Tax=Oryza sativa subsp. japonica TaxID=39947 RepID=A0A0P0W337_ORYSJ|nr:Os03g0753750 [Oryza sativa Japonica Group]
MEGRRVSTASPADSIQRRSEDWRAASGAADGGETGEYCITRRQHPATIRGLAGSFRCGAKGTVVEIDGEERIQLRDVA